MGCLSRVQSLVSSRLERIARSIVGPANRIGVSLSVRNALVFNVHLYEQALEWNCKEREGVTPAIHAVSSVPALDNSKRWAGQEAVFDQTFQIV